MPVVLDDFTTFLQYKLAAIFYKVLTFILPAALLRGRSGRAIVVFPAVAVAAAVYAVLLVGLKAIDEEELRDMPMGTKMIRILKKVRLL